MVNINCKYNEWLTQYTFANCKLNRGDYANFLRDYLLGEKDGFVLNLNGHWGAGKTEFLKRFYSLLISNSHPTIYIDAWESDFSQSPLSVVSSELISQLSLMNDDIGGELDVVKDLLGKLIKGTVLAGVGGFSKHTLGEASLGIEFVKSFLEPTPKDLIKKVVGDHVEQIDAIKKIREQLALVSEVLNTTHSLKLPVVVLVDELDRCRPDYAIKMLEVIKHFFTTKNFVFVVATETYQLKNSIKAVYGNEFDSSNYLKRFFNREAQLDSPDLYSYIKMFEFDFYNEKVILYPEMTGGLKDSLFSYVFWLSKGYGLSIRDVDQLINKIRAFIRVAASAHDETGKVQVVNIFTVIVSLIEFEFDIDTFESRRNCNPITKSYKLSAVNIHSDSEVMLSDLYEVNMHNSVKHEIRVRNSWGDDSVEIVLPYMPQVQLSHVNKSSAIIRDMNSDLITKIHKYNNVAKVWLWSDYQRVAKLAGKIE